MHLIPVTWILSCTSPIINATINFFFWSPLHRIIICTKKWMYSCVGLKSWMWKWQANKVQNNNIPSLCSDNMNGSKINNNNNKVSSLHMLISRSIQMSSSRMSKPWNSWCPYDCLTPYPHYLTSISLLVTPQQIRKASQHLHGDRPQSSRWPQCAAWQLKRKRRAGKWKWVRIRGELHRQREHASVARVHITIHTYPHAQMHVMLQCIIPTKTNSSPTPLTTHQRCENERWR